MAPNQLLTHTMSIGDAAAACRRSVARLKQLDEVLRPVRSHNGARRYDPRVIAEYITARDGK